MSEFGVQPKGFNPFLADPTDYGAPLEPALSNPFLSFGAPPPPVEEPPPMAPNGSINPFLSYTQSFAQPSAQAAYSAPPVARNPFADFVSEPQRPNGAFGVDTSWGGEKAEEVPQPEPSPLIDTVDLMSDEPSSEHVRPPFVPQSTQDLLEKVTGSLEATSDSLLEKLRVTQPSPPGEHPIPLSPSPSPRSPSPDLLGGYDHVASNTITATSQAPPTTTSSNQMDSILDIFDAPSSKPKTPFEILGLYNSAPTVAALPTQPQPVQTEQLIDDVIASEPEPISEPEINLVEPIETTLTETPETTVQPAHVQLEPMKSPESIKAPTEEPLRKQSLTIASAYTEPQSVKAHEQPTTISYEPPKPPASLFEPSDRKPPERPPPPPPGARSPVRSPARSPVKSPVRSPIFSPVRSPVRSPVKSPVRSPVQEVTRSPARPPPPSMSPAPNRPPPPVPPVHRGPPPPVPPQPHAPPPPVQTFHKEEIVANPFGPPPQPRPSPFAASEIPQVPVYQHVFAKPAPPAAEFDAFEAKFNSFPDNDAFGGATTAGVSSAFGDDSAWGGSAGGGSEGGFDSGFGNQGFDSFLSMTEPPPVPQSTPAKSRSTNDDDDDFDREEKDISVVIRPRNENELNLGIVPTLAPPPKSPAISSGSAYSEDTTFVSTSSPFFSGRENTGDYQPTVERTESIESPQTPLYEEDTSQPLEDFPRVNWLGDGWEMHMRHPNKKKITGQRFWKKVYVRIGVQGEIPVVQIMNNKNDTKDPFQEIPLQPCYSVSEIGAQQFDQYGKIFTLKIQYVFYKERPGVRPGQISKAEKLTSKLSQFAAFAIQGDYQGVKEFGSDLKKLGIPVEHAPQISQLVKLGTQSFEEIKQFSMAIEEAIFKLPVHRDRALTYKTEEVQVTLVDEYFVEQDVLGIVTRQIARVRLFFLSFLSGNAEIEMGINDLRRQGREVVGRHDIITIPTEEWIRTEAIEFASCVQLDEFEVTQTIKFKPPDACYIELLRFRVRPPKHRELPLQVKASFTTTGQRVEMRCDLLVPGFTSRKLGQIPCEDVMIRFPIPETWIYMFRVEKHFRYGSVKSAHRRSGKVKGIERFLGAVEAIEQSLMEVTSGQAKYEHHHRAIVWRISRLPKEGQGAYTTHSFFCHISLQAHEEMPELSKHCFVEFTMPHTTISHTVCRSISVPSCDDPPEKCVKYLSRHEYVVEIEHSQGFTQASYNLAATVTKPKEEPKVEPEKKPDSDSDFSD